MTPPDHDLVPAWAGVRTLSDLAVQLMNGPPEQVKVRRLATGSHPSLAWTGADLRRRVADLGARVAEAGVEQPRVVLALRDPAEFLVAFLACAAAGAVAVPVQPPSDEGPPGRLEGLLTKLAEIDPSLVLLDGRWGEEVRRSLPAALGSGLQLIVPGEVESGSGSAWEPPVVHPEDPALIQYSSGSTRRPRGILLSHGNLVFNLEQIIGKHVAAHGGPPHGVSWLPPFHDMGLIVGMLGPLFGGGEVTLMSTGAFLRAPLRWLQAISDREARMSATPPFGLALGCRAAARADRAALLDMDLSSWRLCVVGAEPVDPAVLQRFYEVFAPYGLRVDTLHPGYGLGEATVYAASADCARRFVGPDPDGVVAFRRDDLAAGQVVPQDPEDPSGSVELPSYGPPLAGLERAVVDPETHQRVSEGTVGEIWLRSAAVAAGYVDAPAASSQVFDQELAGEQGGWLATGDRGFEYRGDLFVAGRSKDLVVIHGRNIHPSDPEAVAQQADPRVRPNGVVAFGIDGHGTEQLTVLVALRPDLDAQEELLVLEKVRVAVQAELGVVPVCGLVAAGDLERTSSGKLRRASMRDRFLVGKLAARFPLGTDGEGEAPVRTLDSEDPLAEELGRLWMEALGVDGVRPGDDFFLLGGDSIRGIELLARIEKNLEAKLSPGALEKASQFAGLLQLVRGLRERPEGTGDAAGPDVEVPLLSGAEGHFAEITADPAAFFERGRREIGSVFAMDFGREAAIVCGSLSSVRRVLVENAADYCRDAPSTNVSRVAAGPGMFTLEADDPESRPNRRRWVERGQTQASRLRDELLPAVSRDLAQELRDAGGEPVAVLPAIRRALLRVLLEGFLEEPVAFADLDAYQEALSVKLRDAVRRTWGSFAAPLWVPTAHNRRVVAAGETLEELFQRIQGRFQGMAIPLSVSGGSDLDRARTDFLTFLQAGVAPTSAGIAWTLHLLARRERGRAFLAEAGGGGGESWREAVSATLSEGMRLRPPVAYIERRAVAEDEVDGYRVRAGTLIVISFLALHRDPEAWDAPHEFDPSRFTRENRGRIPRGAFAPFGLGAHRCVGEPLGRLVAAGLLEGLLAELVPRACSEPMPAGQTLGLAYEPDPAATISFLFA